MLLVNSGIVGWEIEIADLQAKMDLLLTWSGIWKVEDKEDK